VGLVVGLAFGLAFGLVGGLSRRFDIGLGEPLRGGLVMGLVVGFNEVLYGAPGQALGQALGQGLGQALVVGLSGGLALGLVVGLSGRLTLGHVVRLSGGLSGALGVALGGAFAGGLNGALGGAFAGGLNGALGGAFAGALGVGLGSFVRVGLSDFPNIWPFLRLMCRPGLGYALGYAMIVVWFASMYASLDKLQPQQAFTVTGTSKPQWWDFLFFAIMTFPPLGGYSVLMPHMPWAQILVAGESLVGIGWTTIVFAAILAYRTPAFEMLRPGPSPLDEAKKAITDMTQRLASLETKLDQHSQPAAPHQGDELARVQEAARQQAEELGEERAVRRAAEQEVEALRRARRTRPWWVRLLLREH